MAKQLTAPGCVYTIVAQVDTTIYSPDQKWILDVPAGQHDFIAETNEIIIPGDAMMCRKTRRVGKDLVRVNLLGTGSGSLEGFITRAIEQIVGKGNVTVTYGEGKMTVVLAESVSAAQVAMVANLLARMLPKDVVGKIDEMPMHYTRLEFLQVYGIQYIDTGFPFAEDVGFKVAETPTGSRTILRFGVGNGSQTARCVTGLSSATSSEEPVTYYWGESIQRVGGRFVIPINYLQEAELNWKNSSMYRWQCPELDKTIQGNITKGEVDDLRGMSIYLFAINISGAASFGAEFPSFRCFYAKLSQQKDVVRDFIPALDPSGTPCMYDTVSRQPFRNAGAGQFIVGMTSQQALNLANLPATGGRLTISLPLAAAFDENVESALNTAAAKGWTITVQYRESELTTKNIDADFLESTGTQYIMLSEVELNSSVSPIEVKTRHLCTNSSIMGVDHFALTEGSTDPSETLCWGLYRSSTFGLIVFVSDGPGWAFRDDGLVEYGWYDYHIIFENKRIVGIKSDGSRVLRETPDNNAKATYLALFTDIVTGKPLVGKKSYFWLKYGEKVIFNMIPTLDSSGTPCMHDTVRDQNFYNQGTGAFIVGFNTIKKAAISLSQLPFTTDGKLTVSLPLEAAFDENVNRAIEIANSRGWRIIVQYSASELTGDYIEADFLESTGTQWIDTSYYPCWDSVIDTEACFLRSTTSDALYSSVEDKTEGAWNEAYFIQRYHGNDYGWVSHGRQSGRSIILHLFELDIKQVFNASKAGIFIDGLKVDNSLEPSIYRNIYSLYLFARNYLGSVEIPAKARIWNFKVSEKGIIERNFIARLDSTGTPCMYDTVSGQNFYNADTSEGATPFTIGFDTTKKAAISISKLPVTTGGTLTVSLPAEAEDKATWVPEACRIAAARGWTIITQYRTN